MTAKKQQASNKTSPKWDGFRIWCPSCSGSTVGAVGRTGVSQWGQGAWNCPFPEGCSRAAGAPWQRISAGALEAAREPHTRDTIAHLPPLSELRIPLPVQHRFSPGMLRAFPVPRQCPAGSAASLTHPCSPSETSSFSLPFLGMDRDFIHYLLEWNSASPRPLQKGWRLRKQERKAGGAKNQENQQSSVCLCSCSEGRNSWCIFHSIT